MMFKQGDLLKLDLGDLNDPFVLLFLVLEASLSDVYTEHYMALKLSNGAICNFSSSSHDLDLFEVVL